MKPSDNPLEYIKNGRIINGFYIPFVYITVNTIRQHACYVVKPFSNVEIKTKTIIAN